MNILLNIKLGSKTRKLSVHIIIFIWHFSVPRYFFLSLTHNPKIEQGYKQEQALLCESVSWMWAAGDGADMGIVEKDGQKTGSWPCSGLSLLDIG